MTFAVELSNMLLTLAFVGGNLVSSMITQVVEVIDVDLKRQVVSSHARRVSGDIFVKVEGRKVRVTLEPFLTPAQEDLLVSAGALVEVDDALEGPSARIKRSQIRRHRPLP